MKDIILYLENIDASIVEYRKKTVLQKITAVTEIDKKDLRDYLTGVTDTCPQLDFAVAAELNVAPATVSSSTNAPAAEAVASAAPQISYQELEEQRQRHAVLFEQSLQATIQPHR